MPADPDDVTSQQRGQGPGRDELDARERQMRSRLGSWRRVRSWATMAVAALAVFACYLLLRHA